jgi:hypothetical protein
MSDDDDNINNNENGRSSSDSSRNLLGKEMQDQLKERRDEQLLFSRFKNVAADSLERLSTRIENDNNNKLKLGDEEKKRLQNLTGMGLKEGIVAGILTFVVLRRGPVYIGRWVRRRQLAQYQNNTNMPPPPSSDGYKLSDPRMTSTNPFQRAATKQDFPRSGNFFIRSIWFVFDVTLSLMMAASTSMAYTDTDVIRQQIIEMPLIQGRSLTSDALCDAIVKELYKVQAEKDPAYERLHKLNKDGTQTPASYYLEGIMKFSANCERRRFMEQRLRQERGLSSTEPVEIPSPGVARTGPRLVKDIDDGQEKIVNDDGTEEPFNGQFGHDMSWANDFVSDQEDDGGRNM